MNRCSILKAIGLVISLTAILVGQNVAAQPPGPAMSAREAAQFDITGQWVSVINEDWRWRMITPPVGDTSSLPMNARGRAEAAMWDLDRDRAEGRLCLAFGAPGIMRQPTRIRIEWEDDNTLAMEFDAGRQTRLLQFGGVTAPGSHSLQGYSAASWYKQRVSRGVLGGGAGGPGSLHVVTTHLAPGYLRPNGVPYSDQAVMREYFNTFTLPGEAGSWLIVTTVIEDPVYLTQEMITSSQFKKERRGGNWNPRDCDIAPPRVERPPTQPGPFG